MERFAFSNFEPCEILLGGIRYPTVEHAYQAAKTLIPTERREIAATPTPGQAKRLGRTITLRPDWDEIRLAVMEACLRSKFAREPFRSRLLATKGEIVELNLWHDGYWGRCTCPRCKGIGMNALGKLLMKIRDERTEQ